MKRGKGELKNNKKTKGLFNIQGKLEVLNNKQQHSKTSGSIIITTAILWTTSNFRLELVKFLVLKGYIVYCVGDPDAKFTESEDRLKAAGAEVIRIRIDRKSVNVFHDIQYFFRLLRVYHEIKPIAALHFTTKSNIYGSLVCRILGFVSINTVNGLGTGFIKGNIAWRAQLFLYKLSYKYQKILLFQNRSDAEILIEKHVVKSTQIRLVPGSGINTNFFSLPSLNIERPLKFIFIGRLIKDKGFIEYIEAARRVVSTRNDAKFFVAGFLDTSSATAITSSFIDRLTTEGLIEYLGPFSDVREAFKIMHVVVLPSYREGMARVLLEAASCCRPIITTDVPGCREVVNNGSNGLLCEGHSSESLSNAMVKMLDMSDIQLKAMGDAGRELVKTHFNSEIVNQIYLSTIKELVH